MKQIWIFLCLSLWLPSCSVAKRVEQTRLQLMDEFHDLPEESTLPARALSWREAVALMLQHNTDYAQAQLALAEARRQEQAVFRSLIPTVNLGYYYNRALFRNPEGWDNGGQFDMNVIFNMPDLLRLPLDKYTRALAVFKAEQDCEMKRRELISKLYLLFLEFAQEPSFPEGEKRDRTPGIPNLQHHREEQEKLTRERRSKLRELLGHDGARWLPLAETLPRVELDDYRNQAREPGDVSQIMMALELEASRLRKMGVALRYWPSTQIDFYSPSLFNMSGGSLSGFTEGMRDVRVNLNLYLQLDTQLNAWQEYQTSREHHELLRRKLRQNMHSWREKMQLIIQSWTQYEEWRDAMEEYIAFRRRQGAQNPEDMLRLYEESQKMTRDMQEQERKNAERIGALIQEYGLPREKTGKNRQPASQ